MLLSEWTKLRSVRSTPLSLAAAFAVAVLGGLFSATGRAKDYPTWSTVDKAAFDPVNLSFDGLAFAQLAFGVIGVLAISSEYTTGQIRTTFAVTPRRRLVLIDKAVVLGAMTLVVGEILSLVSFLVAQLGLRSVHLDVPLSDGAALRAVAGAGIYLVALTLLGLGLGAIIRHTAGAVSAVFGLVFVVPLVATNLSGWISWPSKWNLWAAGNALISTRPPVDGAPSPALGLLICAVYVLVPLALALFLVGRRDA
ncbi:ABC transporter permease [Kribbella qitaiheensis]|uniref:ABC transporter permease n=1 Tax=Kribbella qitaiheensis TaxID=1544730 RepID=A0A7G6WSM8_9ACTN|nr:ABC transporter permease subunit [Kribbella qitaiheensis]QNE16993.1 ABC transporter permease [Kribbella qitaiheensis]